MSWLKADYWYRCEEHKVPYPRGAECPECTHKKVNMKNDTKQVIILRKDLKMRKGKMIAQGAHASMKVFFDIGMVTRGVLNIELDEAMQEWVNGLFTKICVGANSEEELLELYATAQSIGLPCSLIQDAGLTEFDGVPTYTAVAIGPARNEEVDEVTKHLSLL